MSFMVQDKMKNENGAVKDNRSMSKALTPIDALAQSSLAVWIKQGAYVYPAIETLHIIGFATLFGAIVTHHVRILGALRGVPVQAIARLTLPIALVSLLIIVPTGFLLFVSAASDLIVNRAFLCKIVLLLCAGANAGLFHMTYREADGEPSRWARTLAVCSILLWLGVITAGRWIAYV
jgi:hypothetical protein